jgi:hypothetical protein
VIETPEVEASYAAAHSASSGATSVEPAPVSVVAFAAAAVVAGIAAANTAAATPLINHVLRKVSSFRFEDQLLARTGPASLVE